VLKGFFKPDLSLIATPSDDFQLVKILMGQEKREQWLYSIVMTSVMMAIVIPLWYLRYTRMAALILLIGALTLFGLLCITVIYLIPRAENKIAKEYDRELKGMIQEILSELVILFKEKGIDPTRYPLKLRHNDYEGLTYEEKGKNKYIAYVVVE
jgi:hypothetical protein